MQSALEPKIYLEITGLTAERAARTAAGAPGATTVAATATITTAVAAAIASTTASITVATTKAAAATTVQHAVYAGAHGVGLTALGCAGRRRLAAHGS